MRLSPVLLVFVLRFQAIVKPLLLAIFGKEFVVEASLLS